MIEDTIRKIEDGLRAEPAGAEGRAHVLALLAELRAELAALERTQAETARNIALRVEEAHVAARGAARSAPDAAARRAPGDAAERLEESVREVEATHPRLTAVVEALANALAAAGL